MGRLDFADVSGRNGIWSTADRPVARHARRRPHGDRRDRRRAGGPVVGGGISAIQLLDEVSRVTTTTWVTRHPPDFREGPFDEEAGRRAVRLVEERVRRGDPPGSVVSVTGIPITPAIEAMRQRGVLERQPMFTEIEEDGGGCLRKLAATLRWTIRRTGAD